MILKQTEIDQVDILRNGTVQVRFGLLIVENGEVLNRNWHRASLPPGTDVAQAMAQVNAHLIGMGYPAPADVSRVETVCAAVWTPEVISSYIAGC